MKAKHTNWQLKFFIAIMTSWTVFEIFYLKQYNKRMLDQYISKFFPYITKGEKEERKQSDCTTIRSLLDWLKETKNISSQNMSRSFNVVFEAEKLKRSISLIMGTSIMNKEEYRNSMVNINFIFLNENMENMTAGGVSLEDSPRLYNIIERLQTFIKRNGVYKYVKVESVRIYNARSGHEDVHDILIEIFKDASSVTINKKKEVDKMNIGIEFEYDCDDVMPLPILRDFDMRNIVSLSSGYDNDSDNKQLDNTKYTTITYNTDKSSSRLNEDRIRLNGIKGLEGLNKYLFYLNDRGKISNKSSVHIHIDCKYDNSYTSTNVRNIYETNNCFYKYLTRVKFPSYINLIYANNKERLYTKKGYRTNDIDDTFNSIQRNDLNTLEYRGFKTSFQYEDIVMYILVASYMSRCIKSNSKINEEIIKTIIKANKIVKKNKLGNITI